MKRKRERKEERKEEKRKEKRESPHAREVRLGWVQTAPSSKGARALLPPLGLPCTCAGGSIMSLPCMHLHAVAAAHFPWTDPERVAQDRAMKTCSDRGGVLSGSTRLHEID